MHLVSFQADFSGHYGVIGVVGTVGVVGVVGTVGVVGVVTFRTQTPFVMVKPLAQIHFAFNSCELSGHEQTFPNLTKVSAQIQANPL